MANSVHISGLLRVERVQNENGQGAVVTASIFEGNSGHRDGWDRNKKYPVLLSGEQAKILAAGNHTDEEKGFPQVVISGRLFRVPDDLQCFVLCRHIQLTGIYGYPD